MAVVMEGPLSKWTNVVKGWQYRWFVLDDNTGLLSYYTSKDKMMRGTRRGCLRLKGANIGIDDEDDSTFTISCDQKTFHFQARDSEERERWIRALEDTIKRHSQARKRPMPGFQTLFDPSQENLETRLAEAEAYQKILEQQLKALHVKMNGDTGSQDSQRYAILKETSNKMLESMNTCLRQMHSIKSECEDARKTAPLPNDEETRPIISDQDLSSNGTVLSGDQTNGTDITAKQDTENDTETRTLKPSKSDSSLSVRSKSSLSEDAEINNLESSKTTSHSNRELSSAGRAVPSQLSVDNSGTQTQGVYKVTPTRGNLVPLTSYSSSDDEDEAEFFDADEYHESGSILSSSPPCNNPLSACKEWLDKDEFEIEDADTTGGDLDDINKHSSIITHLLSQVRLGMDLTKVVLPTFILERRSLLEMYADFFAHPDLFVDVVNYSNPRDRMVAVVRWYLSAFHAGRKGSVAKKPYNPILGEMFRCFWVLPECEASRTEKCQKDGPVPWASEDDVAFIAEQVSHHPPISAFYAESFTKKISFNAHIWTKSKFLGLSVGVENIGQGCVSVVPYDEDYVLTFPNGYGRSILTVPWIEIGGKTNITCAKSGYQAALQFHCRPFYGGKKHRVTCDVMSPDKKSFLTVTGEWNGQMYAKYADKEEPELFIDTLTMPTVMKTVKKISKQEENESRRLWEGVTKSLKEDDVESATASKHKLEERQRAEARHRKEKGVAWETKLFHEVGENWVYDSSLIKRQAKHNARKMK
ncbi:oxysterol-binding protein-related protein 9-like [Acropora millepora]|uniref:oxysterol-binding protein-related protein 9-like n=1 Tax=Acropora millepora TaxID=45264 RepID=UPI001CF5FCBF|nr:oxysterol-binding protein-related protein 9-like [Acropora millepora]